MKTSLKSQLQLKKIFSRAKAKKDRGKKIFILISLILFWRRTFEIDLLFSQKSTDIISKKKTFSDNYIKITVNGQPVKTCLISLLPDSVQLNNFTGSSGDLWNE